jgi:predicted SnoaL-like aldol condensation-catalyzing enzyme
LRTGGLICQVPKTGAIGHPSMVFGGKFRCGPASSINHWDEADKWLTERYIQHNPLVASGRAGVVKFFGSRPASASCDKLDAPVVAVLADGDLVTVVTVADRKDSKGGHYTTTWFDMWRIVSGRADEHWDPMVKP